MQEEQMGTSSRQESEKEHTPAEASAPTQKEEKKVYSARRSTHANKIMVKMLAEVDIEINGSRPWDIQVHNQDLAARIFSMGSLGLGESYMDGWWDCEALDQFFTKILTARLDERVIPWRDKLEALRIKIFNMQTSRRAWQVGHTHYDLGNRFFQSMLGESMAYSCGYWEGIEKDTDNLTTAQYSKLDLVCRKLNLQPGMRLLDVGCGWGSLVKYAAQRFGVQCTGITISAEQANFAREACADLPVEIHLLDYRKLNKIAHYDFDAVSSIGMFEHVGLKNYSRFFSEVTQHLPEHALFLLHTIGKNQSRFAPDAWIARYIFPNGQLPSLSQLVGHSEKTLVVEDVHNFGCNYDYTLMAWHDRFIQHWPEFKDEYGDRFWRMWHYYLMCCAATFRSRTTQLYQVVFSKHGVPGGYERPS